MFINYLALEKIAENMNLSKADKEEFLDMIEDQAWKVVLRSFFLYYDQFKNEFERQYLQTILDKMSTDEAYFKKLSRLIEAEVDQNPELTNMIIKRVGKFFLNILHSYNAVEEDEEKVKEVLRILFANADLYREALKNGIIDSKTSFLQLKQEAEKDLASEA
jgi:hypothetical protein